MKLGFIGLGKMGSRMVLKLLQEGHEVVVWNRSGAPVEELKFKIQNSKFKITIQNLKVSRTIQELVESLGTPRIIWSMVPAGEATENVLQEVLKYVEPHDIVIDGGNAHFKDTQIRYEKLRNEEIRYLGIGVSGGLIAAEEGYPLMVGGDVSAYRYIKTILDSLSKPHGGHEYFGTGGAGHFVKMVHNGIEYSYMQGIGEGFGVLEKSPYDLDLVKVARLYQKNTLLSGFMMDRAVEALEKDPKLSSITGVIAQSGEAEWTIEQAKEENVFIENIKQALDFRKRSQTDPKVQNSFAAKMVAALRNAFGGHEVKSKK